MPKKLRIPHLLQPKNSQLCVPVCARMAMLAFGHSYSVSDLAKMMRTNTTTGTKYYLAAQTLAKLGFEVHYHDQPYQFPARYVVGNTTNNELYTYIKRKGFNSWSSMIEAGVCVQPRHASIYKIAKMIEKGYVTISAVRPKILTKSSQNGYKGGHALIVKRVDFKKNRVYTIDPGNNVKKQESYTIDHFESARNLHDHVIFLRAK